MTFQITMCGSDGIVMASDKLENFDPASQSDDGIYGKNEVTKIKIDPTGRFAWCFAGSRCAYLAATHIERALENGPPNFAADKLVVECCDRAANALPTGPTDTIVLADAKDMRIMRASLLHQQPTVIEPDKDRFFSGLSSNRASVMPSRYYSRKMNVAQLQRLAAYAVLRAGESDSAFIAGLDVFSYRESVGRFVQLPLAEMEQAAANLDSGIRKLITDG
jgi:hypothetical protein